MKGLNPMVYNNKSAILTEEDAAQIKLLLKKRVLQSRIAAMFDVNGGRISEIKTGQKFGHILSAKILDEKYNKFFKEVA